MKSKNWLVGWFILVGICMGIIAGMTYRVDPYFHYHAPLTEEYFYSLNNQRSQNNGITRHFEYNAIITGTSMTENFMASEIDALYGVNSIKVCYSGATYKEINDNLIVALEENPEIDIIIWGLDMNRFICGKDDMRSDLGEYPTYLYDDNFFNDIEYLINMELFCSRVVPMLFQSTSEEYEPGITSFDEYSNWQANWTFGVNTIYPEGIEEVVPGDAVHLTEEERETIRANIEQNVTSLAAEYPEVTFYYFFTPYSIAYWKDFVVDGTIYRQIEAEQYVIELILEQENIRLYSFNGRTDIITDLNHYKDTLHYAEWINSHILRWMYDGEGLLTRENYQAYLDAELEFYTSFDYSSLNNQEDYESDYYAAALLNEELTGAVPIALSEEVDLAVEASGITEAHYEVENTEGYGYFVFYGKKQSDNHVANVLVYDESGAIVAELTILPKEVDNEWHQYVINLPKLSGSCTIVFSGGAAESGESASFVFGNISLM